MLSAGGAYLFSMSMFSSVNYVLYSVHRGHTCCLLFCAVLC